MAGGVVIRVGTSVHGATISRLAGGTEASRGSGDSGERSRTVSHGGGGRFGDGTWRRARLVADQLDDGLPRRKRVGLRGVRPLLRRRSWLLRLLAAVRGAALDLDALRPPDDHGRRHHAL